MGWMEHMVRMGNKCVYVGVVLVEPQGNMQL
jgi:hypothetical protein